MTCNSYCQVGTQLVDFKILGDHLLATLFQKEVVTQSQNTSSTHVALIADAVAWMGWWKLKVWNFLFAGWCKSKDLQNIITSFNHGIFEHSLVPAECILCHKFMQSLQQKVPQDVLVGDCIYRQGPVINTSKKHSLSANSWWLLKWVFALQPLIRASRQFRSNLGERKYPDAAKI